MDGEKYDVAAAGAEWRREEVEVVGFSSHTQIVLNLDSFLLSTWLEEEDIASS
uniref:Uncharacterized protein n=1 Tax=Setaria viridis TaxID=4556 RepID=A0A4U6VZW0_SETVI|nr:hypothetical protein SEVIR_2G386000v2 [Setaria viridis]